MNTDPVKTMRLFFMDNQHAWPKDVDLAGDLVIWPDQGLYPTGTPVSMCSHPNFDGRIVVQAATHTILVTFCKDAKTSDDIKNIMSNRKRPEQYRVAVDALVQRIMLWRKAKEFSDDPAAPTDDIHPMTLLKWLATACPDEAKVLHAALQVLLGLPMVFKRLDEEGVKNAYTNADEMLSALDGALTLKGGG